MNDHEPEDGIAEVSAADGVLTAISKAELDQQITTARAYPRSISRFRKECMEMATLSQIVAEECFYCVPRAGATIEGPSVRLAEIVASAWGNCRAGARVVDEGLEFVTAQGVFHDLERNVSVTFEVRRRITDKRGKRFSGDMIAVTGNAACAIAMRNAVFKGVPKAFWSEVYQAARKTAVGDIKTLGASRVEALGHLQKMGATQDRVLAAIGRNGVEDVTLDDLAVLKGAVNAIRQGEVSVDEAFPPIAKEGQAADQKGAVGLAARLGVPLASVSPAPFESFEHAVEGVRAATRETMRHVVERVKASNFRGQEAQDLRAAIDDRVAELQEQEARAEA